LTGAAAADTARRGSADCGSADCATHRGDILPTSAADLMIDAPGEVDPKLLQELHLRVVQEKP